MHHSKVKSILLYTLTSLGTVIVPGYSHEHVYHRGNPWVNPSTCPVHIYIHVHVHDRIYTNHLVIIEISIALYNDFQTDSTVVL